MPKYKYSGINDSGRFINGTIVAVNKGQAKAFLKKNYITVTTLQEKKELDLARLFQGSKVTLDDIVLFTRLLSGAIRSGMSLKEALEVLYRQVNNPTMKDIILSILSDIKSGVEMSRAVKVYKKVFPAYYAPLIRAGEETGDLPGVLDQIAEYGEKVSDIRKEVKGMLTYPIAVLCLGVLLVSVVLIKVIPSFERTFAQLGGELPLPTIILQQISRFVTSNYGPLGIGLVLLAVGGYMFGKTQQGKYLYSIITLKIPIAGTLISSLVMINFLKTLATLLNNGVNITQSLTIVQDSTNNVIMQDIIKEMKKNVMRGLALATPLHQNESVFPPMVAYAVDMGERSGNLGEVMSKTAQFYDKQVVYELKQLEGKINPILTALIGGLVLWVALAIYLPIFGMLSNID